MLNFYSLGRITSYFYIIIPA